MLKRNKTFIHSFIHSFISKHCQQVYAITAYTDAEIDLHAYFTGHMQTDEKSSNYCADPFRLWYKLYLLHQLYVLAEITWTALAKE